MKHLRNRQVALAMLALAVLAPVAAPTAWAETAQPVQQIPVAIAVTIAEAVIAVPASVPVMIYVAITASETIAVPVPIPICEVTVIAVPVAIVRAHFARLLPKQGAPDLRVAPAVGRSEIAIERQVHPAEPVLDRDPGPLRPARTVVDRDEVEAQHVAAAIEIARVEQQRALAVVDARLRAGRQHEAAQQRRDTLRVDREFERGGGLVDRPVGFAALQLEQLVGIDRSYRSRPLPKPRSRRR